jgi:alpha-tubulin suppressor-like RCC1 family protein
MRLPSIALGNGFWVMVGSDHKLYSWGDNTFGQLGNGSTSLVSMPTALPSLKHVVSVSAGQYHCIALCSNAELFSWGSNEHGQVGSGSFSTQQVRNPIKISRPGHTISCIACGKNNSFVISDGSVYAWGENTHGQLGIVNKSMTEVSTATKLDLKDIVFIAPGFKHTVALSSNGDLFAFGDNYHGQLGQGHDKDSSFGRVYKVKLPTITYVSSGNDHCIAIDVDGALYSWGNGRCGQLGFGNKSDKFSPSKVDLSFKVGQISCGVCNSFVISTSGIVYACGSNYSSKFKIVKNCPKSCQVQCSWQDPKNWIAVTKTKKVYKWHQRNKYDEIQLPNNIQILLPTSQLSSPNSVDQKSEPFNLQQQLSGLVLANSELQSTVRKQHRLINTLKQQLEKQKQQSKQVQEQIRQEFKKGTKVLKIQLEKQREESNKEIHLQKEESKLLRNEIDQQKQEIKEVKALFQKHKEDTQGFIKRLQLKYESEIAQVKSLIPKNQIEQQKWVNFPGKFRLKTCDITNCRQRTWTQFNTLAIPRVFIGCQRMGQSIQPSSLGH